MTVRAIVSLGSNLEPRCDYLRRAVEMLAKLPRTKLVRESSVIETEPLDVPPEFATLKFLNQVAVFETDLDPLDFSRRMHAIEDELGRVRTVRNGPRTIDLDLIDFGGIRMDCPELVLPHPRAYLRDFVLIPLREVASDLKLCYNPSLPLGTPASAGVSRRTWKVGLSTRCWLPIRLIPIALLPQERNVRQRVRAESLR